jgi:hypothetical protein
MNGWGGRRERGLGQSGGSRIHRERGKKRVGANGARSRREFIRDLVLKIKWKKPSWRRSARPELAGPGSWPLFQGNERIRFGFDEQPARAHQSPRREEHDCLCSHPLDPPLFASALPTVLSSAQAPW